MSKTIPIVIVVIVVVIVAAFALTQTNNNTVVNNSSNVNSSGNNVQAVIIENGTFNPSTLTVKQGTTVVWTVKDSNTSNKYMITSNKTGTTDMENNPEGMEKMYLFMSDHLTDGQSFNYTFNETGTFDYYDMDHMDNATLIGTIIVQ